MLGQKHIFSLLFLLFVGTLSAQNLAGTFVVRKPAVEPEPKILQEDLRGWYAGQNIFINGVDTALANEGVRSTIRKPYHEYMVVDGRGQVYIFNSRIKNTNKLLRKWQKRSPKLLIREGSYTRSEDENHFVIYIPDEEGTQTLVYHGRLEETQFVLNINPGGDEVEEGATKVYLRNGDW